VVNRPEADSPRWAGSVGGVRAGPSARALRSARTRLRAWRMYATRSAAAAARATTRDEKSRAEACYRGAGPTVVRVDAAGDVAEPRSERESRRLLLPRVALGNLGRPGCDSLHRSGLRVLLTLPMRASSSKQAPRGLKPTVERWRLVATRDAIELTPAGRTCQVGDSSPVKTLHVGTLHGDSSTVGPAPAGPESPDRHLSWSRYLIAAMERADGHN